MDSMNSIQVRQSLQLESLESLKTNYSAPVVPTESNNSSTLQSLDSLKANSYTNPRMNIPANGDILAPIDALTPEVNGLDREDTRDKQASDVLLGMVKGFGKAGIDTVKGFATFGSVVGGAIIHPKSTVIAVGDGIKYAVNNPIKTTKMLAIDLPIGIVKGIVTPYSEAISQGKYGEAIGRGVFDIGMVVLTAGLGEGTDKVDDAAAGVEKATKGGKAVSESSSASRLLDAVADSERAGGGIVLNNNVKNMKVQDAFKNVGNIRIEKGAKVTGGITNNITIVVGGNNAAGATTSAGRVASELGGSAGTIERVARGGKAVAGVENIATAGKGLGEVGSTLGAGFNRIKGWLKPVGHQFGGGLTAIIGEGPAQAIGNGLGKVTNAIKVGGRIVKAHPVSSALVIGKATDIVKKGAEASDHYTPEMPPGY